MWGYDRNHESDFTFVPYKTQDEHFALFCLVLERGFALHTGSGGRLLTEFALKDTGQDRYLPMVEPKSGLSFRIPEAWLKPSDLYLYYDPSADADIPKLAYYRPEFSDFIPYSAELSETRAGHTSLPVVKLTTLKGLHYLKDVACLQLFELDFSEAHKADELLSNHLQENLARKLESFVDFAQPWLSAARNEDLAKAYLNGGAQGVKKMLAGEVALESTIGHSSLGLDEQLESLNVFDNFNSCQHLRGQRESLKNTLEEQAKVYQTLREKRDAAAHDEISSDACSDTTVVNPSAGTGAPEFESFDSLAFYHDELPGKSAEGIAEGIKGAKDNSDSSPFMSWDNS